MKAERPHCDSQCPDGQSDAGLPNVFEYGNAKSQTSGPNGKLLWMAMSANKPVSSASGNPFISISLTPKRDKSIDLLIRT